MTAERGGAAGFESQSRWCQTLNVRRAAHRPGVPGHHAKDFFLRRQTGHVCKIAIVCAAFHVIGIFFESQTLTDPRSLDFSHVGDLSLLRFLSSGVGKCARNGFRRSHLQALRAALRPQSRPGQSIVSRP